MDWNLVATTRQGRYGEAAALLERLGARVVKTHYQNVLLASVPDGRGFLDAVLRTEGASDVLARVVPVAETFSFQTPAEFEERARRTIAALAPSLAHRSFHIRMHRRGFKGRLSTPTEERALASVLLSALEDSGEEGHVSFDDPDAIVAIETVDNRAGVSVWTREEMEKTPFLHLD